MHSVETAVSFWRTPSAPSSPQPALVHRLDKFWGVSAPKKSLEVITSQLFTALAKCWMGCWNLAGLGRLNSKTELHVSVREQQQVEKNVSRLRAPINSVFVFCNQPGFRSRCGLYKVSSRWVFLDHWSRLLIQLTCSFKVFQLTTPAVKGPSGSHPNFTVSLNGVAIDHEEAKGAIACI